MEIRFGECRTISSSCPEEPGPVQGFTLLFYLLAQGSGCNWMSALFGFKLWLQLVQNHRKVSVLIALKRTDVEFSDLVKSVVAPVRPEFR